ncbi:MAG: tRNA (N6-isopentenyl adenosine(37)-C2)-methylthiotransferase MiaB [Chlamydiae bacterium]|nr:tRNA (N6-isopentenyl adenosine(37)-C2)-methylthiotransferase MiaB [Chlamydiota bacterium]MBI3276622.1 tRNA (N6-isopentenyl adenosine(37)-C2)-methylthiotransferase MiaB [Chlamydiota bacterium]
MMNPKTFYVKTYGCQMNVYDSEAIEGLLLEHQLVPAAEDEADIILLNACSVRDLAEQKVIGKAGILSKLKRKKEDLVLGICGCMAQNMKDELFKKIPALDLVCGPNDIIHLPKMIDEVFQGKRRQMQVENPRWVMTSEIPKNRKKGVTAWLSVMRGCNHSCTFCIVPRVRGKEVSRSPEDILKEVEQLVNDGFKEVTLLGQNINSYGRDLGRGIHFPKLLEILNEVEGLERIRFTTSHPVDIRDELIHAMGRLDKVCEALHFPLQAGSNRILGLMKRGYTREGYFEKVLKARERIPGVSISTDAIVGFPGETDEDFMETCRAFKEIAFDGAFIFKYSRRSQTPAVEMPDQVPEEVKEDRHQTLLKLQDEISYQKNQSFLGKTIDVLVEAPDKKNKALFFGRSRDNRMVFFDGKPSSIGSVLPICIEKVTAYALYGKIKK